MDNSGVNISKLTGAELVKALFDCEDVFLCGDIDFQPCKDYKDDDVRDIDVEVIIWVV